MRDTTMPDGAWEFDSDVTAVFEDMLERSIPDYGKMRVLADRMAAPQLSLGVDPVQLDRVLDGTCAGWTCQNRCWPRLASSRQKSSIT